MMGVLGLSKEGTFFALSALLFSGGLVRIFLRWGGGGVLLDMIFQKGSFCTDLLSKMYKLPSK